MRTGPSWSARRTASTRARTEPRRAQASPDRVTGIRPERSDSYVPRCLRSRSANNRRQQYWFSRLVTASLSSYDRQFSQSSRSARTGRAERLRGPEDAGPARTEPRGDLVDFVDQQQVVSVTDKREPRTLPLTPHSNPEELRALPAGNGRLIACADGKHFLPRGPALW